MDKIRTRFAPSPTGYMHVGNLRSAIFEYLIAKSLGGDFVLRIEDTDQERYVNGATEFIYNVLDLCDIKIDESPKLGGNYGPYIQSERLHFYKEYAHKLVEMKKAYYCFCDEERLNSLREKANNNKIPFMYDRHCHMLSDEEIQTKLNNGEKYVIRQLVPNEGTSEYEDLVYGKIKIENKVIEDQILLKSDGYPTYNFANVIDDHLMNINYIARGNEYLSSTPKYNLLYESFGWERPKYIHLPMVLGSDGQKLSKRNGDASFIDLVDKGFLPQAIVNYLTLLGFSPSDNIEIFNMEEAIKKFDIKRINKAPATFDIKKLEWVNSHYIKKLNEDDLYNLCIPFLEKEYNIKNLEKEWLKNLILLYQKELSYGEEITKLVDLFFKEEIIINSEELDILVNEEAGIVLNEFENIIKNMNEWNNENINMAINEIKEKTGIKGKMLFMPIRIKISGQMHGPDLINTIYLLGKDKIISRLQK